MFIGRWCKNQKTNNGNGKLSSGEGHCQQSIGAKIGRNWTFEWKNQYDADSAE